MADSDDLSFTQELAREALATLGPREGIGDVCVLKLIELTSSRVYYDSEARMVLMLGKNKGAHFVGRNKVEWGGASRVQRRHTRETACAPSP
jgi:hypothetical protein